MTGVERDLLAADLRENSAQRLSSGYARRVRLVRYFLGLVLFAVVAAVLLWPEMNRPASTPGPAGTPKVASNELVKPRFESIDSASRPFTLSAARAVQHIDNPDLVDLEEPVGDMTLKDGTVLKLRSQKGLYRQNDQIMDLSGEVKFEQNADYTVQGERVRINMKTQDVLSTAPVQGTGNFGTIRASGLTGNGETGTLVFHGPATLVLKEGIE